MTNTVEQMSIQKIFDEINKIEATVITNPWAMAHYTNLCEEFASRTKKCKYEIFEDKIFEDKIFEDEDEYDVEFEKELLKDIKDIKEVFKDLEI